MEQMITSQTLTQAREALVAAGEQKRSLQLQVKDQARKIAELEREVQKLASTLSQTQQSLVGARQEIQILRSQLPDEATQRAFDDLTETLTAPSEAGVELRLAA
jgi:septal ring factor EnvC (AmiA/AmiB activator)